MMSQYETQSGEPVPEPVAESFGPKDEWDHLDPQSIGTRESFIGTLFHGVDEDGYEVYASSDGWTSNKDRYEDVTHLQEAAIPRSECDVPFTYNESPEVVHNDHFVEHVTKAIVVGEDGRTVVNSRSGVLWLDWGWEDRPQSELELGISLVETGIPHGEDSCIIETPDEYARVVQGWHDSMWPSDQSDVVNALATGDIPPEMSDDVFPYVVRFGDTNNCCSQPASIYANEQFRGDMEALFKGKRATPARGGFS